MRRQAACTIARPLHHRLCTSDPAVPALRTQTARAFWMNYTWQLGLPVTVACADSAASAL